MAAPKWATAIPFLCTLATHASRAGLVTESRAAQHPTVAMSWGHKLGPNYKIAILPFSFNGCWRMGRDSNPRYPCEHAGFQDRCLKPLGHPSIQVTPRIRRFRRNAWRRHAAKAAQAVAGLTSRGPSDKADCWRAAERSASIARASTLVRGLQRPSQRIGPAVR